MNKKIIHISLSIFLLTFFIYTSSIAIIKQNLSDNEFNQNIKKAWKDFPNINERFVYHTIEFLGTKYTCDPLGEGKEGTIDKDPLCDFNNVDCVTFIEQCLALAMSKSKQDFLKNLNKIRYKDGKISYITRNHYSIIDWLPNNKWLVTDATKEIGGKYVNCTERIIDKQKFFQDKGIKTTIDKITTKTSYIPKEKIIKIKNNLSSGLIIFHIGDKPGIFVLHWGVLIKSDGKLYIRHASSVYKSVVDEELFGYLKKYKFIKGLKFIRINNI